MTTSIPQDLSQELADCGWRWDTKVEPDGKTITIQVPLTEIEFLHPQEGYHLPNSTFHDNVTTDAKEMLARRYANDPSIGIFSDLLIEWDIPELKDHCPDVCVVFGLRNKEKNRRTFVVETERVRPALIIEVVSPRYRKVDREIKVKEYAQAGVLEYGIVDRRTVRGQVIEEVLGHRLVEGNYLPITPDEEGRILCETVGLWISLQSGQVIMEDSQTGDRLLRGLELEQRIAETQARATEAEQQAAEARQQAAEAQARAARLEELLREAGIDPEQI